MIMTCFLYDYIIIFIKINVGNLCSFQKTTEFIISNNADAMQK